MVTQSTKEKINQLRYKMMIHSYIYYRLGDSIIDDSDFDRWGNELVALQEKYPQIASECVYAEAFLGFDATTGFHLPRDEWVERTANRLHEYHKDYIKEK
jgi:NAD-dependent DNA ligase